MNIDVNACSQVEGIPCEHGWIVQQNASMLHFLWVLRELLHFLGCNLRHSTLCCLQIGNKEYA